MSEIEDLRAKVARVEALAFAERELSKKLRVAGLGNAAAVHDTLAMDIDRALAGPAKPEAAAPPPPPSMRPCPTTVRSNIPDAVEWPGKEDQ